MDRMAYNLRMANAEGVDRGVVDVDLVENSSTNTAAPGGSNESLGGADQGGKPQTTAVDSQAVPSASSTSTANPHKIPSDSQGAIGFGSQTATVSSTATGLADATSSAASKSGGGGGGGIGTGAIVGIVVGVVGGLLLIAAVAFFLLRKRRQKKNAAGYDGADTVNAYMVDKETQGRATDSPNSPYSDENQHQHVALEDVALSEPPHERGIPRTSTSLSQGRGGTSGVQTPQGVSSNVAHLVEDGMTADEIRRLEEEERQLDDEIERAARR